MAPSHSADVLARLSPRVPDTLAARAEAWRAVDTPAPPLLSASVVLLRQGGHGASEGLETYLLHRHARMAFAASMVVFPGGRVDIGDSVDGADPLRQCALRETREETGVRLVENGLHDWAHWTTPEFEPRRFETRFFVAVMPEGQVARDISGETDRAGWSSPEVALAQADRGLIALMPPTRSILIELAESADLAQVLDLARDRVVVPVLPRLVRTASGWRFSYPGR